MTPGDLERYRAQKALVDRIIGVFEDPGYSDTKEAATPRNNPEVVLHLMNEVGVAWLLYIIPCGDVSLAAGTGLSAAADSGLPAARAARWA